MAQSNNRWFTTGAVARLCSVSPDTVQKWIKSGRIVAQRTAGGHYRVAPQDVEPFRTTSEITRWFAAPNRQCSPRPLRCWEYLSESGEVREDCRKCVVYRVGASWCFEVLGINDGAGHARSFCRSRASCTDCAYYRQVYGMPKNVLVVTADAKLITNLGNGSVESMDVRFARNAYQASSLVGTFRPAFVVVDVETLDEPADAIVENLLEDTRVPGLRLILCGKRRKRMRFAGKRIARLIEKPFDRVVLAAIIDSIPVERKSKDPTLTTVPGLHCEETVLEV
jgi:excisionase family DNA binding protein